MNDKCLGGGVVWLVGGVVWLVGVVVEYFVLGFEAAVDG